VEDGVWRTIGGRRVFIKDGQSLSDAMKESGKFKGEDDRKKLRKQFDEKGKSKYFRHANKENENTDEIRGGTWYTNDEGSELVTSAKEKIGGDNIYNLKVDPQNPLVIDNAILEDGSFSIINSGYENFIDSKYVNATNNLYEDLFADKTSLELDKCITKYLNDFNIPQKQITDIMEKAKTNKFDSAIDAVMSKALREKNYDSLILKDGKKEHVFVLAKNK
jgi:hypothetical protein